MPQAFKLVISNMIDELSTANYKIEKDIKWKNDIILVNMEYINRIFENIISNINKYANKNTIVRIETLYLDNYCGFSIMNNVKTTNNEIESNKIGINSIVNMTKKMHGICNVEQSDTSFEITLLFLKKKLSNKIIYFF